MFPFREISREIRERDLAYSAPKFKPRVGRAREEHRTGPKRTESRTHRHAPQDPLDGHPRNRTRAFSPSTI